MNQTLTIPLPGTTEDPRYPDQDGRFMGDTDFHNSALSQIKENLEDHFAAEPDVYVASNLLMYYKKGDPKARKDPDILFARGVGKHRRRSYRFWEEKKVPRVLFEVASRRTWRVDVGEKRWLYAKLGVKEYFLYDPEGVCLEPTLQGFRLVNGRSVPIKPNADGSLTSRELGLRLMAEGDILRFIDAKNDRALATRAERAAQAAVLAEEKEELAEQKKDLERRNARLAAANEKLRRQISERESPS